MFFPLWNAWWCFPVKRQAQPFAVRWTGAPNRHVRLDALQVAARNERSKRYVSRQTCAAAWLRVRSHACPSHLLLCACEHRQVSPWPYVLVCVCGCASAFDCGMGLVAFAFLLMSMSVFVRAFLFECMPTSTFCGEPVAPHLRP